MTRFIVLLSLAVVALIHSSADAQQFTNLLQNKSLSQWMLPNGKDVENGWTFDADGTLHLQGKGDNIITRNEYQDFELWFEYRISDKGNSGIKYRVQKYGNSLLGIEYQIQDDAGFPNLPPKHYSASLYDIMDRSNSILERKYSPAGEFNVGRIVVQNHRIRHWMNGNLIIDELDCSPKFANAIAQSKFKDQEGFGKNHSGRLMLTDHGSEVWYKNLYIRPLSGMVCLPR